jgi:hypothetical protein
MWHKARAKPSQNGAGWPRVLGQLAMCWRLFKFHSTYVSRKVGARGIQCESWCGHETWPPSHPRCPASLTSGPSLAALSAKALS